MVKGDEADDLNQEVWIKVYKRISTVTDGARFKTWLFQMTRNKALDFFRGAKRMEELKELLRPESEPFETAEENDFRDEEKILVQQALNEISPVMREALVLNFYEGMDYQEIALITGCSVGTVRSRLHHAKNSIKQIINSKN